MPPPQQRAGDARGFFRGFADQTEAGAVAHRVELGHAAPQSLEEPRVGLDLAGQEHSVGGNQDGRAVIAPQPDAFARDPLDLDADVHRDAPPVESVHLLGPPLRADFGSDPVAGLEHRDGAAALGQELGELDRREVRADDRDAAAERHP